MTILELIAASSAKTSCPLSAKGMGERPKSTPSSAVAYLSYGLFFKRFLSLERVFEWPRGRRPSAWLR
jgi:hypothetical protein